MASVLEVEAMMGKFDRAFNHTASLEARLRAAEEENGELRRLLDEVALDRAGLAGELSATKTILRATEDVISAARVVAEDYKDAVGDCLDPHGYRLVRALDALAAFGEGEAGDA